jgi:L,D-transpeptidase ErfK/SrfK
MLSRLMLSLMTLLFLAGHAAAGGAYSLRGEEGVVGIVRHYRVKATESLHEVARLFDLGYNEITAANPGVDPWLPGEDSTVTIPSRWVLPDAPQEGVVINLAELRLYLYSDFRGTKLVRTYPIGVGKEGFDTPTGRFGILEKTEEPSWVVPESIRKDEPSLPEVVPPGPENPLGSHALRLSRPSYLIHGTNRPFGVGRRVSHGCIRLYPEDIGELYVAVGIGSVVDIVYQPIKVGAEAGEIYVEVHRDYLRRLRSPLAEALGLLRKKGLLEGTNLRLLKKVIAQKRGFPEVIGREVTGAVSASSTEKGR